MKKSDKSDRSLAPWRWRAGSSTNESKRIELSPLKEKLLGVVEALAIDLQTTHPDLIPKFLIKRLMKKRIPEELAKVPEDKLRRVILGARNYLDELLAEADAVVIEGEIVGCELVENGQGSDCEQKSMPSSAG